MSPRGALGPGPAATASRRRAILGALALATALVAVALTGAERPASGATAKGPLRLKPVGNFENPVFVTSAPGRPRLLFVVEQRGTVRVIRRGRTLRRPFLDLEKITRFSYEEGLLSIAFDPRYRRNRRLYVYYVNRSGDIRVDSLKRRSPTRAAAGSRRRVIEIAHPENANHNGGQLEFGPDGLLYLGTGDGGGAGDPDANAQNPDALLGKLLRIAPRRRGYSTPADNPFADGGGAPEVYALGLRNPYRFSFDRRGGDIWIGDVGQGGYEEIDRARPAAARGANFGWNLFEGNHPYDGGGEAPANYAPPVFEYPNGGGNCAVTGGYVARDRSVPALAGRYLYADFCAGEIRSLRAGARRPASTDAPTGLTVDSPSSFGEGAGGRLYVSSLSGRVYRIKQR